MIASTQKTNNEIFAFITVLVFTNNKYDCFNTKN